MPKLPVKSKKKKKVGQLRKEGKKLADVFEGVEVPQHEVPLWKGPEVDGITQSMLQRFLNCRERFRLKYIEGLTPPDAFHHRLEYGSLWHICEEYCMEDWKGKLHEYVEQLYKRYPLQAEAITKWADVCLVQFPQYLAYYAKKSRKVEWIEQEVTFDVVYTLPSSRRVRLRGKRDGVLRKFKPKRLILRENKTKGDVEEQSLVEQLGFDLQTMFYVVAHNTEFSDRPVYEVEYNVVRRPLSGGKGTIRPLQNVNKGVKSPDGKALPARPETMPEYYARLGEYIANDPSYFFMRWDVTLTKDDISVFTQQFLNPILEQLCDWWDWVEAVYGSGGTGNPFDGLCRLSSSRKPYNGHWRHPYGVYNVLDKGGSSEYDEYLLTGSEVGLVRGLPLFPELD